MLEKLEKIEERFAEVEKNLSDPAVVRDRDKMTKFGREYKELETIVIFYRKLKSLIEDIETAGEMLEEASDSDRELMNEELRQISLEKEKVELEIKKALIPKDPDSDKSVIMEIRAGTGGDEAALFATVLFRMYTRYAEGKNWKWEILSSNEIGIGGFKEIQFAIDGKGAYEKLRFEGGTHRVQRVPSTESGGRIHTSAVTVAVLIEPDEVDEIEVNNDDLRIDTFRASSAGGQHVNKTDSAIRLTHLPTGIVISSQDQRSQHQNKEKAMRVLKAYLLKNEREKIRQEHDSNRKSQVGTGDRSGRIRTYNFPQSRITDHRIGLTLHQLPQILEGDIDEIVNALVQAHEADQMASDIDD